MALLSFPTSPTNGQIYPASAPAGINVYQWSSTDLTWRLLGTSTGVAAGTYGNPLEVPQFTVELTGEITFAQNVAIQLGDTSQVGLVQLVDDTVSNDSTKALTAAQGYKLQNDIGDISLLSPPYPNLVSAVNAANSTTGVGAGSYGNSLSVGQFTVNAEGKITSATNVAISTASASVRGLVQIGANLNVTGSGILSVATATTATAGVTRLVDNTTTNDSTRALTAAAGFSLQQQIDSLAATSNLTFAGTLDGATGQMVQVTPEGSTAGFVPGVALPVPSATNKEYFVVVVVPGTFTPSGSPTVTVNDGDWLVSAGTQWVLYAVGPTPSKLTFIDNISAGFNNVQKNFTLKVSGVNVSPGNNLLIFVGGVAQIPGVSYNVTGFTISFVQAPPAGATFIGVTVI